MPALKLGKQGGSREAQGHIAGIPTQTALNSCLPELTMCLGVRTLAGFRGESHGEGRGAIRADREWGAAGIAGTAGGGGDGGLAVGRRQKWGNRSLQGCAWRCKSGEDDGGGRGTCVSAAWQLCFAGSVSPGPAGMSSMCWGSMRWEGQRSALIPKAAGKRALDRGPGVQICTPPGTLTFWLRRCSSS